LENFTFVNKNEEHVLRTFNMSWLNLWEIDYTLLIRIYYLVVL